MTDTSLTLPARDVVRACDLTLVAIENRRALATVDQLPQALGLPRGQVDMSAHLEHTEAMRDLDRARARVETVRDRARPAAARADSVALTPAELARVHAHYPLRRVV